MTTTYRCSSFQCPNDGLEFFDRDEWLAHLDAQHEITCTNWDCDNVAAYRYNPGAPGSYYYCADHADQSWDSNATMRERIKRVTRSANDDARRLPDDHPVEVALSGLYNDGSD